MIVEVKGLPDATKVTGYGEATETEREHLRVILGIAVDAMRAVGISRIYVTSWKRGTGAHSQQGSALDFAGIDRDSTLRMWVWIAQNQRNEIGEVIYEQPKTGTTGHVHLTRVGVGGVGQVLYQREDGGGFIEIDPFLIGYFRSIPDSGSDGDGGAKRPAENIRVRLDLAGLGYVGVVSLEPK